MQRAALLTLALWLTGSAPAASAQPGSVRLEVSPSEARIGLFYSGLELRVSAETAPGLGIAVLVRGPSSTLVMRKNARIWGVFWAPGGEVTFEGVPSLYLLATTAEPRELAPAAVLEELGIGYEALRSSIGSERSEQDLFVELIRLKESEQLFHSATDGMQVQISPVGNRQLVKATLHIPARALATIYSVRLFGFRAGQLVTRGEGEIKLTRGWLMGFVSSLAREHGLLYGLFAVVVALAAGLLVGFLFGTAKKR